MNTTDVENYPGFDEGIMGPDLMQIMRKQTENMGTKIIDDVVTNVDFSQNPFKVSTASTDFKTKAVIVCTGATPRKIGLEGEQTFAGKGVSYCATCDGAFFRDQELAVVGGGDSPCGHGRDNRGQYHLPACTRCRTTVAVDTGNTWQCSQLMGDTRCLGISAGDL